MKYLEGLIAILLCAALLSGCSDSNSSASLPGEPHPAGWVLLHGAQANQDLRGCQVCHGADFTGVGQAVSCFSCHLEGPPFAVHPASWGNVIADHQDFPSSFSWTQCANAACHGTDLRGGSGSTETGPSCFLAGCHLNAPPNAHEAATSFTFHFDGSPGLPQAKDDLLFCRNCHGRPPNTFDGGFVADPAILARTDADGNGNCSASACHPDATAHPTNWVPDTSERHTNAGNRPDACTICHNLLIDTTPGNTTAGLFPGAPSCFSPNFTNANGIASACHPGGPEIPHELGVNWLLPSGHVAGARANAAFCLGCHSAPPAGQGISPLCADCHRSGDPLAVTGCRSCHNIPPNGAAPAGNGYPNRDGDHGDHGEFACSTCHFGFGTASTSHWPAAPTTEPPADIRLDPNDGQISPSFTITQGAPTTCNGSCHGEGHGNRTW